VILETIVTTLDPAGAINFAPMGVEWGEEIIVLKPFLATSTFRNLLTTRTAVVNLLGHDKLTFRAPTDSRRRVGAVINAARPFDLKSLSDA